MKVKGPPPTLPKAALGGPEPVVADQAQTGPQVAQELSASFDGVTQAAHQAPVQKKAGTASPLSAMFGAPKDPKLAAILDFILPQGAVAADLSKTTTVFEALSLATDDELMGVIRARFSALKARSAESDQPRLQRGVQMADIGRLVPGQTRISIQRVREKVAGQVKYDGFTVGERGAVPAFADGKATVPLAVPKPAVAGPGGQILVIDGNHQAVASMLAGAEQTPVDIVADHQDLTPEQFAKLADDKGWTYLKEFGGADATKAADYASLQNDPVRFLMTETALKASLQDGQVLFEDDTRPETRVWVKLKGPTVDFVEFIMADVVYAAADRDPALRDRVSSPDLATRSAAVRAVLTEAAQAGVFDPDALGILLLDGAVDLTTVSQQARARIEQGLPR